MMVPDPLDALEDELRRAAARQLAAAPSLAAHWRPGRGLLAVAVAMLCTGGAAYAGVRLTTDGSPVAYPSGRPATAKSGYGVPVPGSMRLLPLRVADAQPGPPWGIRVFHTTRGYGCAQVGRVVRGRLGVLGEAGSFADDGRFHELRAGVIVQRNLCVPLDDTGHAHLAVHDVSFRASGRPDCVVVPPGQPAPPHANVCPEGALRAVDVGFAGPDARQVRFRDAGGTVRTQATGGPDGAYLVVLPSAGPTPQPTTIPVPFPRGAAIPGRTDYVVAATPGAGALVSVEYADGTTCRVRRTVQTQGSCPEHGPVRRAQRLPSTAAVRSPVRLRLLERDGHLVALVHFRARIAAAGTRSAYNVLLASPDYRRQPRKGRFRCAEATSSPVQHDVPAGKEVRFALRLLAPCTGRYVATVQYRIASAGPRVGGFGQLGAPGRTVGSARAAWPAG